MVIICGMGVTTGDLLIAATTLGASHLLLPWLERVPWRLCLLSWKDARIPLMTRNKEELEPFMDDDEAKIKFHVLCGGKLMINFKTIYPDMYSLSVQKENLISQIWSPQGWNLLFRRPLNDWEIERFSNMLSLLQQFKGLSGNGDKLLWINNEGKFTVKSAYARWNQPARQLDMWPWKHIWKVKIPYKVSCFVWLVVKSACLTHENLQKRGFQICSKCLLFGEQSESNSHLFLHCKTTGQLWDMFFNLLGITWTMPRTTLEFLISWITFNKKNRYSEKWRMIPGCVWWIAWRERNSRCFEDKYSATQKLEMNCLLLFYFWCKQDITYDMGEVANFLGNL